MLLVLRPLRPTPWHFDPSRDTQHEQRTLDRSAVFDALILVGTQRARARGGGQEGAAEGERERGTHRSARWWRVDRSHSLGGCWLPLGQAAFASRSRKLWSVFALWRAHSYCLFGGRLLFVPCTGRSRGLRFCTSKRVFGAASPPFRGRAKRRLDKQSIQSCSSIIHRSKAAQGALEGGGVTSDPVPTPRRRRHGTARRRPVLGQCFRLHQTE